MATGVMRVMAEDFLSLFFPETCAACNGRLLRGEHAICLSCITHLPRTFDEKDPAENPVARVFWGRVRLRGAVACFVFTKESKVQELVHNLKYNGRTDAGIAAGKIFGNALKELAPFNTVDIIAPVPLHEKRLRKRGYNQAACFGEGLAGSLEKPMLDDAVLRLSATQTQTKKSRLARWENVEEVFSVNEKRELAGKHILLVDDVITTGATIEACAAPLLALEGTTVSVAALASAR